MKTLFIQLGPLGWPLLVCSFLSLVVIIERLIFFVSDTISFSIKKSASASDRLTCLTNANRQAIKKDQRLGCRLSREAILYMALHIGKPRLLREEVLELWLNQQSLRLKSHIPWLVLIAVVSPLLGLLGTVLGMIQAFQNLAASSGPVHPALVADGLQLAMLTTAAGLAIAVPSLIAVHVFRIWSAQAIARAETLLNQINLMTLGVSEFEVEQQVVMTSLQLVDTER